MSSAFAWAAATSMGLMVRVPTLFAVRSLLARSTRTAATTDAYWLELKRNRSSEDARKIETMRTALTAATAPPKSSNLRLSFVPRGTLEFFRFVFRILFVTYPFSHAHAYAKPVHVDGCCRRVPRDLFWGPCSATARSRGNFREMTFRPQKQVARDWRLVCASSKTYGSCGSGMLRLGHLRRLIQRVVVL